MAVPKRKTSKSKRDMRSANKALTVLQGNLQSGVFVVPHVAQKTKEGYFYKGVCVKAFRQRKEKNSDVVSEGNSEEA